VPDRKQLCPGDTIRIVRVPQADLDQRERELVEKKVEDPGMTANALEKLIVTSPIVTIDHIDEYGFPWFECKLLDEFGREEIHSFAIMEDESWELLGREPT